MSKLLSEEVMVLVYQKVAECIKKLNAHYKVEFELPDIRFDLHNEIGGLAYPDLQILRFNLILLLENREHYLANVVPHEVAHLFVPFVFGDVWPRPSGHGSHWHEVMGVLGVPANMYHTYDTSSLDLKHPKIKGPPIPKAVQIEKKIQSLLNGVAQLDDLSRARFMLLLEKLPPPPPKKLTLEQALARQKRNKKSEE